MHRLTVISKARSTTLSNTATWLPGEKCINTLEVSYSCRERLTVGFHVAYGLWEIEGLLCIHCVYFWWPCWPPEVLILSQWNVVETQGQQHRNRNKKRNQITFEPSQSDPMLEGRITCTSIASLALLASDTPGVAPLASLAPVTWVWCCMGAGYYSMLPVFCYGDYIDDVLIVIILNLTPFHLLILLYSLYWAWSECVSMYSVILSTYHGPKGRLWEGPSVYTWPCYWV